MSDLISRKKLKEVIEPIADKLYRITYIHSGMGLEKDWVVFAIEEVKV